MSSIINATTNNGLVITPDNSGQIQFQLNGVNVPSPSVAPAFSAYAGSAQSFSAGVSTKVQVNTKTFDTNNNFDAVTNYRFTPTVAGYYQVNALFYFNIGTATSTSFNFYKNGNQVFSQSTTSNGAISQNLTTLIYMNGSTDYLEVYAFSAVAFTSIASRPDLYSFSASLVRTA